jgi:hypothetical protein
MHTNFATVNISFDQSQPNHIYSVQQRECIARRTRENKSLFKWAAGDVHAPTMTKLETVDQV